MGFVGERAHWPLPLMKLNQRGATMGTPGTQAVSRSPSPPQSWPLQGVMLTSGTPKEVPNTVASIT